MLGGGLLALKGELLLCHLGHGGRLAEQVAVDLAKLVGHPRVHLGGQAASGKVVDRGLRVAFLGLGGGSLRHGQGRPPPQHRALLGGDGHIVACQGGLQLPLLCAALVACAERCLL